MSCTDDLCRLIAGLLHQLSSRFNNHPIVSRIDYLLLCQTLVMRLCPWQADLVRFTWWLSVLGLSWWLLTSSTLIGKVVIVVMLVIDSVHHFIERSDKAICLLLSASITLLFLRLKVQLAILRVVCWARSLCLFHLSVMSLICEFNLS